MLTDTLGFMDTLLMERSSRKTSLGKPTEKIMNVSLISCRVEKSRNEANKLTCIMLRAQWRRLDHAIQFRWTWIWINDNSRQKWNQKVLEAEEERDGDHEWAKRQVTAYFGYEFEYRQVVLWLIVVVDGNWKKWRQTCSKIFEDLSVTFSHLVCF